jgi:nucleoid DNA-binding protein
MARKATSTAKIVKLKTVVPDPVVTPLAKTAAPQTKIVNPAVSVPQGEMIKKPEFLDRAVERTDVKKREAKPAIEAALAVPAVSLINSEELNLPPMGKLRVVKSKDVGEGAKVLTLKLRTMKDGAGQGADPSPDEADAD